MFNVQYLYCVGKVSYCISKSCRTSWFPCICTIYTHVIQNGYVWKVVIVPKSFFLYDTSSCNCSIYLYLHCICKVSVKDLVQVYVLCMHYLSKQEKMAKFTKLSFCQNFIFWHQTSSCKCWVCPYYVGKVSDGFSKSSVPVVFPVHALSEY